MVQSIISRLPAWSKRPYRWARGILNRNRYKGTARHCPICGFDASKFLSFGVNSRDDAMCPNCESKERDRFAWLYLNQKTDLFDGKEKKVLHVAPERCFEPRFKARLKGSYITADFMDPRTMVKMDIQDIQYPDNTFDVIYCSHVLEHVDDDRKAMREFQRVLKPSGWAILLVPITVDVTVEDPSIKDPAERLRLFGQHDHVRSYGPDYLDRLLEAGFKVLHTKSFDMVSDEDRKRMGLNHGSAEIFYCTK